MTKTEGGQEQELVLGNKQLLSVFFIVVALLGVFFTMGYIIGRNTGTVTSAGVDTAAGATAPKPVEARNEKPENIVPEPPPASEGAATALPPANPPPQDVVSQPAKPYEELNPAGAVAKPKPREEAPPVARQKEVPRPKEVVSPPKEPAPPKQTALRVSEGSHFLQVMAVKRTDAEKMQKILQGHGFPVSLRESSKEGLFRVLVGPYEDRPALSKAKDDLKSAGFDSIVAR